MSVNQIKVAIIGGTGLEDLANHLLQSYTVIKCEDAKNDFGLPSSDIYEGKIAGVDVVLLSRHRPGHKIIPSAVNYRANIEALRLVGCTHILASTACGSLTNSIEKGQLVIPDSFIDRTVNRKNTFYDGTSARYSGCCYIPMKQAFDKSTSDVLCLAAKKLEIPIKKGGTVVTIEGPRFSSTAESKMYQLWGGHLINMTTCPEVFLAKEAGLLYASIAIATDYDSWKDDEEATNPAMVFAEFKKNIDKVIKIFKQAVQLIGKQDYWDKEIADLKNLLKISIINNS